MSAPPEETIAARLSPALRLELSEADALPEIAVVFGPTPELLEAYALDERVGVIAVVAEPGARLAALEAGALEAVDPTLPEAEARARVQTAVARFRSRLRLERSREELQQVAVAMERNLRLAAQMQRSFLPRVLPDLRGARFATAYLPREFVSGDSYDVRTVGPSEVALCTLDSVGHDVRAALVTVLLRAALRPREGERLLEPHEVVGRVNRALLDANLEDAPTAAMLYAVVDVASGRARLANAGHPLPLVLRADGSSERVGGSGLLLGIDPEPYETVELVLAPGEALVLFTDGVDPDYDARRFREQLRLHADLDLEDQLAGALGATIVLDAEGRPEDDITVVACRILGG